MRSREASQLEGGRKNQSSLHLHPTYMEPQSIHTYADASFTIDDISAPWTGGEEIMEIIWVEKYNDPSVQRRQLIDEEPSNSSFAIERAIDRNRAFAILFINVLLVPRIYCAKSKNSDFCTFEILFRFAQWNFWSACTKGRTKKIVGKL